MGTSGPMRTYGSRLPHERSSEVREARCCGATLTDGYGRVQASEHEEGPSRIGWGLSRPYGCSGVGLLRPASRSPDFGNLRTPLRRQCLRPSGTALPGGGGQRASGDRGGASDQSVHGRAPGGGDDSRGDRERGGGSSGDVCGCWVLLGASGPRGGAAWSGGIHRPGPDPSRGEGALGAARSDTGEPVTARSDEAEVTDEAGSGALRAADADGGARVRSDQGEVGIPGDVDAWPGEGRWRVAAGVHCPQPTQARSARGQDSPARASGCA